MIYVKDGIQEYVPHVSKNEKCIIDAPCFARGTITGKCCILSPPLPTGKCSFCKADRHITNGKFYPDNPLYTGGN